MHLDGALRSPSGYISAARAVKTIRSRRLRHAVWEMFETSEKPVAPMPDLQAHNYEEKAKRAAGLNESVEMALAELRDSVVNPGVRESLPGVRGMAHPMPPPIPPPMGPVGVGAGDEAGGGNPTASLNGNSCSRCHKHPAMQRGLCAACLGRDMAVQR